MTFNFLGPGLTVNVEAKVKEQIILDSSDLNSKEAMLAEVGSQVQCNMVVIISIP